MHEAHAAQTVLNIAIHEARRHAAKGIKSVRIIIGRFSCLNPESLNCSFEALSRDTIAKGARLEVERAESDTTCPRCQTALTSTDDFFSCPGCGEPAIGIKAAEDVRVDSLEVET